MKLLKIKSLIIMNLIVSCIPWNMHAQTKTTIPESMQPISLSSTDIEQKINLLKDAETKMSIAKKRITADLIGKVVLGSIAITALTVAVIAASGGTAIALAFGETASIATILGTIFMSAISGAAIGVLGSPVAATAGISTAIIITTIFKTIGIATLQNSPLSHLLFLPGTRTAIKNLEGLDKRINELNELKFFEKENPTKLTEEQKKIMNNFEAKIKDPIMLGLFRSFDEKILMINIIRKAIELDSSLRAIIKNDPEKTAKLIAKYIVLNRNFGNYMAALNELAYDKKKREIFRLRGLARTKVSLQFKATQKQIAKIERKYPQLTRLKNELVGMYRKESSALDEKYAEMLKK